MTFTVPRSVSSRWAGLGDADEAAPVAIASYLRAYGPATFDGLAAWLGGAVDKRPAKKKRADASQREASPKAASTTAESRP